MVALIRGGTSLFPCPTCLVEKEKIPELSKVWEARTSDNMQRVWKEAQVMNRAGSENHLKKHGLRDVEVSH